MSTNPEAIRGLVAVFGRASIQGLASVTWAIQHHEVAVIFNPEGNGKWRITADPFQPQRHGPPRIIPDDLLIPTEGPHQGKVLRVLQVMGVDATPQAVFGTRWIDVIAELLDEPFCFGEGTITIMDEYEQVTNMAFLRTRPRCLLGEQRSDDQEELWRSRLCYYRDYLENYLANYKWHLALLIAALTSLAVAVMVLGSLYLRGNWQLATPTLFVIICLVVLHCTECLQQAKQRRKEQLKQTYWLLKHLHDAMACKRRYYTKLDSELTRVLDGSWSKR